MYSTVEVAMDPALLEHSFQHFIADLPQSAPDGIIPVNLELLQKFGLVDADPEQEAEDLTRYFYVVETNDKITLYNDQFAVWIVPENLDNTPTTYVLIAILSANGPELEVVFSTAGVYNSSKLVLRVLEKFIKEIQEHDELIGWLSKA